MSDAGSDFDTADLYDLVCQRFPEGDPGVLDVRPSSAPSEADDVAEGDPHTCIFSYEE